MSMASFSTLFSSTIGVVEECCLTFFFPPMDCGLLAEDVPLPLGPAMDSPGKYILHCGAGRCVLGVSIIMTIIGGTCLPCGKCFVIF